MTGHAMLAGIVKAPELELDESEAGQLAVALSTVNAFYHVEVAEKTMAWVSLAMVAGTVYGSRLVAIGARRREERGATRARPVNAAPVQPVATPVSPGTAAPKPMVEVSPVAPASTGAAYQGLPPDTGDYMASFPGQFPFN